MSSLYASNRIVRPRFATLSFLHEALTFWQYAAEICIIENTHLARLHGTGRSAVIVPEMRQFAAQYGLRFICCTQDHFEHLEMVWDDRYERRYGFWRPYVMDVIRRYLECGDPHFGFARVKCTECQHEYLLPFSCKRRHFCPSCHRKRVVEFGAWLCEEVLKAVPHRQWVFSIPKILRRFFMTDRRLLCKLRRCAWKVLSLCMTKAAGCDDAGAGAAVADGLWPRFKIRNQFRGIGSLPFAFSACHTC